MNHVFYVIPLLLVISIPMAFAEVGKNYDTVTNEDGTITWTSHPERILVDNEWQNYFLTVNDSKVIFNSNSAGSFVYDISTCSYSIYENGWELNPQTQIIPSVSAVATYLNNGTWQNMNVNESSCNVTVEEVDDKVILTSTKENRNQKFQQELILDINSGFKETFKVWHEGDEELGISQTVHTGESITIADQTINIAQLNGQSFDKQFITDNEAEILQLTDSINYDFDKGIESLSNVNIIFDDDYKVNLDYAHGMNGTAFINYLEIDPTFTTNNPDLDGVLIDKNNNNVCDSPTLRETSGITVELSSGRTGSILDCKVGFFEFPISGIPSNSVVSNVDFEFSMYGVSNPRNCDYVDLGTAKPSTATDSDLFDEILLDNDYTDNDSTCTVDTGTTQSVTLGGNANSDVEASISSGVFYFGIKQNSLVVPSSIAESTFSSEEGSITPDPTLVVTYTTPTIPDAITDLSASFNSPNIDLTFSTPNNGNSAITSFKVYRDTGSGYSLYDTVNGSSLTSYQDTNPVLGVINYFKVNAVNGIGEALDSNVGSVQTGTPPGNPTGLTSTIQDANNAPLDVFLQWSSPVSWGTGTAQGFEVYRNGVLITTTGLVNSYTDTVTAGSHSHYVKAVSSHGTSGNSNTANITTPSVPDAITDLSGVVISDTQINVTWTAPSDGGSNIDLYKIFRDGSQIDTTTNTSYSLTGLTANTSYAITVYANNSVGDSLVSNSVTLTTYVPVSGSITVTPNTQGATTQLTFSASGITGTPTPTFSTFTLKEGITVVASGITSPYILALDDNSPHTYTITSTDNTHWNTPTISGSTTVTASYDPTWSNGVSYNYTRASGVMDLTVNQNMQSLWDASCNYKTTAQVMADQSGIVSNHTGVWYISESQNIADTDTVYVSCSDDGTKLFSFTSFGPNRLGGGIAQLDDVFGDMTGTPVALIFVLLVAGLFTGRSAPTGILLVLALIGVLGFIGMLTIDEAVWGFLLLAGVLGIFLGKRFL